MPTKKLAFRTHGSSRSRYIPSEYGYSVTTIMPVSGVSTPSRANNNPMSLVESTTSSSMKTMKKVKAARARQVMRNGVSTRVAFRKNVKARARTVIGVRRTLARMMGKSVSGNSCSSPKDAMRTTTARP